MSYHRKNCKCCAWVAVAGVGGEVYTFDSDGNELALVVDFNSGLIEGMDKDGDGKLYAAGQRTTTWPGSAGANASAWRFALDGTIEEDVDPVAGQCWDIAAMSDGRFVVVHDRPGSVSVTCYTAAGASSWTYDTGATARGVAIDGSDNVYVVGFKDVGQNALWKLNSSGSLQWSAKVTHSGADKDALSVAVNSGGTRIAVTDFQYSAAYNSGGTQIWTFAPVTTSGAWVCKVDTDDDVYIGGNLTVAPDTVGGVFKLNGSTGAVIWGANSHDVFGLDVVGGGDAIVITDTNDYIRKLDSAGSIDWSSQNSIPAREHHAAILL